MLGKQCQPCQPAVKLWLLNVSNKCIATSNKGIATSRKKLLVARCLTCSNKLLVIRHHASNALVTSSDALATTALL